MEKHNNVSQMNTPKLKTQALKVLVVSTNDKENASPEVFYDSPTRFNFPEQLITLSVPALDQDVIRPYMAELAKIQLKFGNGEEFQNMEKERMDTISTLESLEPIPSRTTTQNRQRGFQIPVQQQSRVLSDITSVFSAEQDSIVSHTSGRRDSHFDPTFFNNSSTTGARSYPTFDFKQLVNKENSRKNDLQTPFQMKNVAQKDRRERRSTVFGMRNRNIRRSRGSMRL